MKKSANPMAGFRLPSVPTGGAGKAGAAVASQFAHHVPSSDIGGTRGLAMRMKRPRGGKGPHNPVQG